MSIIYLLRHGEIATCRPRRFVGSMDIPLTSKGRDQIARLADMLADYAINQVVCSPLARCRQSGSILCNRLGISLTEIAALAEINLGRWEGLSVAEVEERFPGQYAARGKDIVNYRPEGGESFQDLLDRVWPPLISLSAELDKRIVIVSHAGVNRVLLCRILGMPLANLFQLEQHYGCLNILHRNSNDFRVECINLSPNSENSTLKSLSGFTVSTSTHGG